MRIRKRIYTDHHRKASPFGTHVGMVKSAVICGPLQLEGAKVNWMGANAGF
jgi:hypothetical protein